MVYGPRTSSTFFKIALKRVVKASRFFASSECPVCAPLRRSLILVNAIRVGKTFSRGPVPDILGYMMDEDRLVGVQQQVRERL